MILSVQKRSLSALFNVLNARGVNTLLIESGCDFSVGEMHSRSFVFGAAFRLDDLPLPLPLALALGSKLTLLKFDCFAARRAVLITELAAWIALTLLAFKFLEFPLLYIFSRLVQREVCGRDFYLCMKISAKHRTSRLVNISR